MKRRSRRSRRAPQRARKPGEFVLGYPKQKPAPPGPEPAYGQGVQLRGTELDPEPGETSFRGPSWAKDGSYLVVRRLRQDVPAFSCKVDSPISCRSRSS
jgi:deferrochelatase/peroxidase EfeB